MRAGDQERPTETPRKPIGSDNGYSNYLLNPIQSQSGRVFRGCGEDDWREIVARFWSKVKKTESCWLWTGHATGSGVQHGKFALGRVDGKPFNVQAHRFSWYLSYGQIPDDLNACHYCDVPLCVRPEHLFIGTQATNLLDAIQKGRLDHTIPRTRVLSLADRLAIYHMPDRRGVGTALAIHYGVSTACISLIRRGRFIGSPTAEGKQRPSQALRASQHRISGAFKGAGFSLEPAAYRQLKVRGEVR